MSKLQCNKKEKKCTLHNVEYYTSSLPKYMINFNVVKFRGCPLAEAMSTTAPWCVCLIQIKYNYQGAALCVCVCVKQTVFITLNLNIYIFFWGGGGEEDANKNIKKKCIVR